MAFEALKNKSIGIIIPDFDYGGEEKRALFFANHYLSYFKKVYLIAPAGAQSKAILPGVQQVQLKIRGYKNVWKVVQAVKKEGIDFIQGHKRTTFPYLYAIEKFTHAQVNFNFDNIYLDKEWLYRFAPRRLYYLSDDMRAHYLKWFPRNENITINMGGEFYNQLPEAEKAALKKSLGVDDKFILISLGRLSDQKNQEVTLKALHGINDPSLVCLVVGEGPKEPILRKLVIDLKLENQVRFLGHRTDVNQLLNMADVLVQSSIFEGFPNVFIEAVSVGTPIITTRVGSYGTLVKENGITVPSNDVDAFAKAIVTLKEAYPQYKQKAITLRDGDFFQQFHKSKMLENYLAQYNKDALN